MKNIFGMAIQCSKLCLSTKRLTLFAILLIALNHTGSANFMIFLHFVLKKSKKRPDRDSNSSQKLRRLLGYPTTLSGLYVRHIRKQKFEVLASNLQECGLLVK